MYKTCAEKNPAVGDRVTFIDHTDVFDGPGQGCVETNPGTIMMLAETDTNRPVACVRWDNDPVIRVHPWEDLVHV